MKNLLIFILLYGILFIVVDLLHRKFPSKGTWSRKATHISGGIIAYFLPDFLSKEHTILIALIFTLVLLISRIGKILTLHDVKRNTIGEILFPVSIGVLALICLPARPESFKMAVLALTFSDGLAGVIGEKLRFAEVNLLGNTKSAGGSIVFFICTMLLLTIMFGWNPEQLTSYLLISGLITLTEFISLYGFDNLSVPVVTAILVNNFIVL